LPTFAQAMSSTTAATPTSHVATLESLPWFGPRSRMSGDASARGFASSVGRMPGLSVFCAM
jgi:hypothetical protein